MSEDINNFSGFTPLIHQVDIGAETTMLDNNGNLVKAHIINIKTKDGLDFVFSIDSTDLVRLFLLINKILILS